MKIYLVETTENGNISLRAVVHNTHSDQLFEEELEADDRKNGTHQKVVSVIETDRIESICGHPDYRSLEKQVDDRDGGFRQLLNWVMNALVQKVEAEVALRGIPESVETRPIK